MNSVSYPFVVLSKSAKVIPVILVGTLRGVYSPKPKQYAIAFFITMGLVIFNLNKVSTNNFGKISHKFIYRFCQNQKKKM
jgi:hypothetical protein